MASGLLHDASDPNDLLFPHRMKRIVRDDRQLRRAGTQP